MPWLIIEGEGSWHFGRLFGPGGPYEVDRQTADAANREGIRRLRVIEGDLPPEYEPPAPLTGTLTLQDLGRKFRTEPPAEEVQKSVESTPDPFAESDDDGTIPCPRGCGKRYSSEPALERHVSLAHADELEGVVV